jgi:hypothetical protein
MKTLWLVGGLGLGAGLMYMLDPEQGKRRRALARAQLAAYENQAEDLLNDTTRTLGQQAHALLARPHRPLRRQPGLGAKLLTQAEQLGLSPGLCLLGCVGVGAGLLYMLEPSGGARPLALIRDTARAYWHKTNHALRSAAGDVYNHTRSSSMEDAHAGQRG